MNPSVATAGDIPRVLRGTGHGPRLAPVRARRAGLRIAQSWRHAAASRPRPAGPM